MSFDRPLRGSCACHRNQYLIRAPEGVDEVAQVLFGTSTSHRRAQASPLSAHIRVPLSWYHSATFSYYPDETATQIRRVFENPREGHTRRHFCGFCGTPLTYWSEHPRAEADYIQVTVGSLCREDLGDLDEMGLLPDSPVEGQTPQLSLSGAARDPAARAASDGASEGAAVTSTSNTASIPWFDSLVAGSSLGGRLKTTRGTRESADGATRVEWEILEYDEDGGDDHKTPPSSNGKRKLGDRDDVDDDRMEGVSQS